MRLCIIVSNSLRKDPRVIKQIKCALDEGIEVHFIGFKDKHYSKEFLDNVGCNIHMVDIGEEYVGHLRSPLKKLYRKLMHYYLPIKIIKQIKPDIIHSNDFDTLIQSYIGSKLSGANVLYDSHEICAENINIADKKIQKNLIILFEKFLIKRVGAVVSVSHASAAYFQKKYNINKPTVVTNCPYTVELPETREKNNESFEVLYQGLMMKGRGYEEFVSSGKFLNDGITLVIRGYGSIENHLREIIVTNGLIERVRFDGPVEIVEIIKKASESDLGVVFTQPININFKYTVSNKIYEYLQAGLPVLLSDIPEHQYLNDKYHFGVIIKSFSSETIALEINSLASDPIRYNELKNNAIKASKELTWENESKKLLALYHSLKK